MIIIGMLFVVYTPKVKGVKVIMNSYKAIFLILQKVIEVLDRKKMVTQRLTNQLQFVFL